MHEVAFLPGGSKGGQAGLAGSLFHTGKIEMGGQVLFPRGFEGVLSDLMTGVGLQSALTAVFMVILLALKAVVSEEKQTVVEDGGQFFYEGKKFETNFRGIAVRQTCRKFGEVLAQRAIGERGYT